MDPGFRLRRPQDDGRFNPGLSAARILRMKNVYIQVFRHDQPVEDGPQRA